MSAEDRLAAALSEGRALSKILAALRPTTPDERENWALTEDSLIAEIDGKFWFFDNYDDSGVVPRPVIWNSDESGSWALSAPAF